MPLAIAEPMNASYPRFCRGFLRGSVVGCALLAFGLLSWGVAILVGVEKDTSLTGFSLTPLYVLSFGLGGGVHGLMRSERPRWHETAIAWAFGTVVVLLGCGVMECHLVSERPIEWVWGAGSATVFFALLGLSLFQMLPETRNKTTIKAA